MARHIWQQKRLAGETVERGARALRAARAAGWHYDLAVRFVGYYLERQRQSGLMDVEDMLPGCMRTGHRYARGRNRDHYLAAGAMVLVALAVQAGLPGCPAPAFWDWLNDNETA